MTGRLLAQLADVAWRDSENVNGPPYAWPAPPPMTDEQRREGERLRALAQQLSYAARRQGFVDLSGDAVWGEPAA